MSPQVSSLYISSWNSEAAHSIHSIAYMSSISNGGLAPSPLRISQPIDTSGPGSPIRLGANGGTFPRFSFHCLDFIGFLHTGQAESPVRGWQKRLKIEAERWPSVFRTKVLPIETVTEASPACMNKFPRSGWNGRHSDRRHGSKLLLLVF
jgi:hypothetical protein